MPEHPLKNANISVRYFGVRSKGPSTVALSSGENVPLWLQHTDVLPLFCSLQLQIPVLSLPGSLVGPYQVAGTDGWRFRLLLFIEEAELKMWQKYICLQM